MKFKYKVLLAALSIIVQVIRKYCWNMTRQKTYEKYPFTDTDQKQNILINIYPVTEFPKYMIFLGTWESSPNLEISWFTELIPSNGSEFLICTCDQQRPPSKGHIPRIELRFYV